MDIRQQVIDAGYNPETIGRRRLAKVLGVSTWKARTILGSMRAMASVGVDVKEFNRMKPELVESFEETATTRSYSIPKTRIKSLDELIAAFNVDTKEWTCDRFVCNKWEVGAKINNEITTEELYQVKAWFIRRKESIVDVVKEELDSLIEDASYRIEKYAPVYIPRLFEDNLLELSIPDLHYNKLAWDGETGHGNWDHKISEKVFCDAMDHLVCNLETYNPKRILFVIGNDLLHTDNTSDTTAKGTAQDVDSRYYKSYKKVREMKTRAIEKLRTVAPVDVLVMPGNHDLHSTWHLGDSLECLFQSANDVIIDNHPKPRKYYQFGKNLIGITHGDSIKRERLPLLMAAEASKMFGETTNWEVQVGHWHTDEVKEYNGIKVRTLPSLCRPDAWHSKNGYVMNSRQAHGLLWNSESGLIATSIYTDKD